MGELTLVLAQPSARRAWELREGAAVRARLSLPVLRSGGSAEIDGRRVRVERRGLVREDLHLVDEATGELVARVRREGRQRLLEVGDHALRWRRLGRREGHGFVDDGREPVLRARTRAGLLRTGGTIEVERRLGERESIVAAVAAAYLVLRDQEAAAAAASVAAT